MWSVWLSWDPRPRMLRLVAWLIRRSVECGVFGLAGIPDHMIERLGMRLVAWLIRRSVECGVFGLASFWDPRPRDRTPWNEASSMVD